MWQGSPADSGEGGGSWRILSPGTRKSHMSSLRMLLIRMLLIRYAYAAAESSQRTSEGRGSSDATHATHTLRMLLIRYA